MNVRFRCVLSTVESDSHLWNLVYLQKLLEENGASVHNLGPCTPVESVADAIRADRPDLLVVSSVNGHGFHGAQVLLSGLRERGLEVPCAIGGKLTTAVSDDDRVRRELLDLGYTDVFLGDDAIARFRGFLRFGLAQGFSAWRADPALITPWDSANSATRKVS
ncbi:cobalamin B12-binding domain-containing protein [Nocardia suismassiliense]|uniref:cobalamin B12-binding domain-containing protein n=1 Tax=Nocardia suismassiliense TaxID=2077092 RepID=UPI000D1F2E8D|nr:cobalamin-dependent protein [Nocardia suismassiliense]